MNVTRILLCLLAVLPSVASSASVGKDVDITPVIEANLDIAQVEACRTEGGQLLFRVSFAAPADPDRLRILIDADGPEHGEPASGADYMLEGSRLYRYPEGARDWTWNAVGPAVIIQSGRELTCILPDTPGLVSGRWFAETTQPDWSPADRAPNTGTLPFNMESLQAVRLETKLSGEDLGELVEYSPRTLSFRLDAELKNRDWQAAPTDAVPGLVWSAAFMTSPIPLRLTLTDGASGEIVALTPERVATASNVVQWSGSALGIGWMLMMEPADNGDVWLTGQLQAEGERCVRVGVGCEWGLTGWTWHDDVRSRRAIEGAARYGGFAETPFGLDGSRSLYPFGVISSDAGALIVETDPDEPRIFQIVAEPAAAFFGLHYDLALTGATSNFPGRATFRCALRSRAGVSGAAFREALAGFLQRNPDFLDRRVPTAGQWLALTDPVSITNALDFGFAFFEMGEGAGDREFCRANGILPLSRTEPWLYRLPMPAGMERKESEAVRLMDLFTLGSDRQAELAAAARLGAACGPDGAIRMEFPDTPRNPGARMAVNTDPDLRPTPERPLSPAMAEWRQVKKVLGDPLVQGLFLDSMALAETADYNPQAMAVADYPCSFERGVLKPCLVPEMAEYEFTAALARTLRVRGQFVMGSPACRRSPFFMKYVDVPGEEVDWLAGGRYERMDDAQMNFRRALSGAKPFALLTGGSFETLDAVRLESFLKDCLFWGFLPGLGSDDGGDSYWSHPAWYDRDRPLFRTYLPLIRRIALAGWRPMGSISASPDALWVEEFGNSNSAIRHVTVRNTSSQPVAGALLLPVSSAPLVVVDPLGADCQVARASDDGRSGVVTLGIMPGEVRTFDVFPLSAVNDEIAFLRTWRSGGGEAEAVARSLESLSQERDSGVACSVSRAVPAVRGETNALRLEIVNEGASAVEFSEFKIVSSSQFRPFDGESRTLAPEVAFTATGEFESEDAPSNSWLEVQWTLTRDSNRLPCVRMIRPRWHEVFEFRAPAGEIAGRGGEAIIELSVRNDSRHVRDLDVRWQGDFRGGRVEESFAGGESRVLRLPVTAGSHLAGRVTVQVFSDDERIFKQSFEVRFQAEE